MGASRFYKFTRGITYVEPAGRRRRGPRAGAASGVIVRPANGYAFRYDIRSLSYFAVRQIPAKTIVASFKFVVTNDYDAQSVEVLLDRLKSMAGYVTSEIS